MRRRRPTLRVETLEGRRLLAVVTVNSAADVDNTGSVMTLREAILLTNGTIAPSTLSAAQQAQVAGAVGPANTIDFAIPGAGVHQILPTTQETFVTRTVTIDGYSQPGSHPNTLAVGDNAVPLIELSGTDASFHDDGLFLDGPATAGSVIQGLVINDWGHGGLQPGHSGGNGIYLLQGGGDVVRGNFFGTDPTGLVPVPNLGTGVYLTGSHSNTVGGPDPASRNVGVVGGAATGQSPVSLFQETGDTIQNNYLGVGANGLAFAGLVPASNAFGVDAPDSTLTLVEGNVLSSVRFYSQQAATAVGNNTVQGNKIGVDATGLKALPGLTGVEVDNSTGNLIGGGLLVEANEIASAGGAAVRVGADHHSQNLGTVIVGNDVGSDPTGAADLGDVDGVRLAASYNFVGGADPTLGNRISHSSKFGVEVDDAGGTGQATRNPILSNRVTASGAAAISYNPVQPETPTVSLVGLTATGTTDFAAGAFHGVPGATYTVQFYLDDANDRDGAAEGQTLLASQAATARDDGLVTYSWVVPLGRLAAHQVVTVTATGPGGNTSQFANGLAVGAPLGVHVAIAASPSGVLAGQPVTLTATVTAAAALWTRPGGNVVFMDSGVVLGVAALGPSGVVQFGTSRLAVGTHHVTASYRGDATYPGTDSTFTTVVVVVTAPRQGIGPPPAQSPPPVILADPRTAPGLGPTGALVAVAGTGDPIAAAATGAGLPSVPARRRPAWVAPRRSRAAD